MTRAEKVFYEQKDFHGVVLDMFKVMNEYCPQDYGYGDTYGCESGGCNPENCFKCWMKEVDE